jgi:fucose permease
MKDEIEIKDYLILRSFFVSSAIIGGALTAMIFDYFGVRLGDMLIFLSVLGVLAIVVEYMLYKKFRNILQDEDTIIERQKVLLNEKITYSK